MSPQLRGDFHGKTVVFMLTMYSFEIITFSTYEAMSFSKSTSSWEQLNNLFHTIVSFLLHISITLMSYDIFMTFK